MGHTPGHMSKAMSWHAPKPDIPLGSTKVVLATAARLSHNPVEADLKEVQRRFQAAASKPDGPAVSSIFRARHSQHSVVAVRCEGRHFLILYACAAHVVSFPGQIHDRWSGNETSASCTAGTVSSHSSEQGLWTPHYSYTKYYTVFFLYTTSNQKLEMRKLENKHHITNNLICAD